MCAFAEKAGGGGNTRSSCCRDSMFVVVEAMADDFVRARSAAICGSLVYHITA
jgi:hypothetical protein